LELQYFGANCVKLSTKTATLVVDDNLASLGLKPVTKPDDIAVFTSQQTKSPQSAKLAIDSPGEYEVSDVSIQGIAARAHTGEPKTQGSTIFKIVADNIRVGVLGHIHPELSDAQLESLGTVDVLVVPVGGGGYTLDPVEALKLIKKIEPKTVIPTHFADKASKYEVPQLELSEILKELAMEPKETVAKLKLKPADWGEGTQLIVLERQ
jgi:L-ascorbate metabolism protein UlaG (beta-lactamase superfamily)